MSGSYDTTVRFWNLDSLRCVRKCEGHEDAVRVLAVVNGKVRAVQGQVWGLGLG